MKKLLIPAALLLSCFFIGCATTEKTVDTNKTSYEAEKNPGVETEKKSESTGTKEKAPETKPAETKQTETKQAETKPAETKQTETKQAETKPTETKQPETKQPAQTEKKQEEPKKEPEKQPEVKSEKTPAPTAEQTPADYGIKDVGSLDAACRTAKFSFQAPSTFAVYKPSKYRAAPDSRIEIVYMDSKKDELTVVKGAGNLDVSTDETSYNDIQFVNYAGIRIMLKGKGEEKFNVATWISGDYSYSVETSVAFPKEVIFALVQELY